MASTYFPTNTPDNHCHLIEAIDGGNLPTETREMPHKLRYKILLNIASGFFLLFSIAGFAYNAYALHMEYHLQDITRRDLSNTPDNLIDIALNKEFGTIIDGTWAALIVFLASLAWGGVAVFLLNCTSERDQYVFSFIAGAVLAWLAAIFQMAEVWDHVRGYETSFEKFDPENGILNYNTLYYGAIAHIAYAAALTGSLIFAAVVGFCLFGTCM